MSTAQVLFDEMTRAGFILAAGARGIRVTPADQLTDAWRERIRAHRDGLLAILRGAPAPGNGVQLHEVSNGTVADAATRPLPPPEGSLAPSAAPVPSYQVVTTSAGLAEVVQAIEAAAYVSLDTEASAKDPHVAELRLLQLAIGAEVYVIDCAAIDPAPLWPALARTKLVVCNAAYDLVLLWRKGLEPGRVCDLMLMSRLLTAGTTERNGLKDLALRYLNLTLDKEEQASDWTGELTQAQLDYAALDARMTFDLCCPIMAAVHAAKLTKVADVENRTAPALCWLARAGAPFDLARWDFLATGAGQEAEQHRATLDALSPFTIEAWKEIGLKEKKPPSRWNWGSARQVAKAFERVGLTLKTTEKGLPSTSKETLAKIDHPIAKALIAYNDARDRADYGRKWAKFVRDGRVFGQWSQIGSSSGPENVTGRTSVSDPPLQAVRKDLRYRQCFVAPPGRVWIKADYNQLQLRIAAKITGDKAMCAAYAAGGDLHSVTALRVTGQAQVTKEERSLAKSLNFGLLFGMGVERFQTYTRSEYGIDLTLERAVRLRNEHFAAYPGLREWHNQQGRKHIKETRSILGRRRLFPQPRFTEQLASPVQGSEADGAKLALALLYERRHLCPGAFPVLFVHDEIDVEADASQADAAAAWLKDAMMDGMREILAPIPCVVEVDILPTWGGVPDPLPSPPPPSPDPSPEPLPPAAAQSDGVSTALAPPSPPPTVPATTIVLPPAIIDVLGGRTNWGCAQGDCLDVLASLPRDATSLVFGSPPYVGARLYLEDSHDLGIARDTDAWVRWMVQVYRACLRVCTGLVAFVVEGQTKNFSYDAAPILLAAELSRGGICLRKPPVYRRVGIPGSGGKDWLRNDYEFIICATRGGKLPWSDNTTCGQPPKYKPGGAMSYRTVSGERCNAVKGRGTRGKADGDLQTAEGYKPPKLANPGNIIDCRVGGGRMGSDLAHENEAPFPEELAEFFVKSYCPPGDVVLDPFAGSGTTLAVALRHGRRALGIDLRGSQVELTQRRIEAELAKGANP
jgi:DNA polymerase-1